MKCENVNREIYKDLGCFVINLLNNKTIILLNLAEYRLILAKYQTIFCVISQDNCYPVKSRGILSDT